MKIAIITDTHQGARNSSIFREYHRQWWRDVFIKYLNDNNIKSFLHGGDFFDNRTHMHIEDLNYVVYEFSSLLAESGIHMHIVAGNHDVCYRNTNNTNSLIFPESNVTTYVDDVKLVQIGFQKFLMVPWINHENETRILSAIKNCDDKANTIILGHFEIAGALMYPGSRCEHGLDTSVFIGFQEVWSGHFHQTSITGNIRYLGSAFELTWQDYNQWRGFYVYDTETRVLTPVANEYQLFFEIEYDYNSLKMLADDHELSSQIKGRFVRLVVNTDYNKVQLLEVQSLIQKQGPISLQVIDNTILKSSSKNQTEDSKSKSDSDSDSEEQKPKTVTTQDMVVKVMKDLGQAPGIITRMVDIFSQAEERMSKGE